MGATSKILEEKYKQNLYSQEEVLDLNNELDTKEDCLGILIDNGHAFRYYNERRFNRNMLAKMACRKNLNKNAISAFEEYGVQRRQNPRVEVVTSTGPQHKPCFLAEARLGEDVVCTEEGMSKHEARIKAAERALQMLSIKEEENGYQPEPQMEDELINPVPYKDPVSALMEYAQYIKQDVGYDLVSQEGPPHMPIFTMEARLGQRTFDPVKGSSSKESKKKAACAALITLKKEGSLEKLYPASQLPAKPMKRSNSKSMLGIPGKNPVSVLNEFAQKKCVTLKFESTQTGPPHRPIFQVTAILDSEKFPTVEASNKKEGNVMAAEAVLEVLLKRGEYTLPSAGPEMNGNGASGFTAHLTHHDKMAAAALRKIDELLLQTPESLVGRKVVAAIIMTDPSGATSVVSVGTGNRCIKGSLLVQDGTRLHDSHAEILARRGFKRFLYRQLESGQLLVRGQTGKWTFKPGVGFHMYISTAPCGDGAIFTHSDKDAVSGDDTAHNPLFTNKKTQGLLRAKQENGEGTIPIEAGFPGQTYDGIRLGGRLRIMACSDKICQWNVVGIQGGLLSLMFEPVYLQSITLGNLYHHGHLSRALCCRVDYDSSSLSSLLRSGYRVQHPQLGVVTLPDSARAVQKARPLSINWCLGDEGPEVTDGTVGMTIKTVNSATAPSRVCKMALLALHEQHVDSKAHAHHTYRQLKLMADEYNKAKYAFRKRMSEQGLGEWIPMPEEVDRFGF